LKFFRQRWFLVLVSGVLLLILASQLLRVSEAFFPLLIIIGPFIVPVTFVTFIGGFERRTDKDQHSIIPPGSIAWTFIIGGLIGVVGSGILEFATLRSLGIPQLFAVGLIEESAKLILPLVIFARKRYQSEADGILFGVASGMGFSALETIGYGFVTFAQSNGGIGPAEQVLIARGLFSPAGHAAWTGLVCAVIWRERIKAGHAVLDLPIVLAFVAAVILHASWDIVSGVNSTVITMLGYLVIAAISLTLLILRMREARNHSMAMDPIKRVDGA
jgi:RsiW-degrading membrane proteinase PrsW (M82 family)